MTLEGRCPYCRRSFAFAPDEAPAQRWEFGPPGTEGRVLAYYPACPGCAGRVEVPDPRAGDDCRGPGPPPAAAARARR
jgi:hypothetical protein